MDYDTEKKIDQATSEVVKNLGLDKLQASINKLEKSDPDAKSRIDRTIKLLDLEEMCKNVGGLTSDERNLGFFAAAMRADKIALKALAEGTSADGGYLFPDDFRNEIIRDIANGNYMRKEVTVVPMRRDVMKIPTLDSRPQVTWTEENTTKSTTTASFDEATLTVYKMAAILYASDELVEDSSEIPVVEFIIQLFSEVIGEEEDRVIWRGNGTTQPTGIATARAGGTIATRTATAGLTLDEVINLMYDLPTKYHGKAKFYTHFHNIRDLRKLKDSNNQYLWQPSNQQGEPALLSGFPVIHSNELPDDQIYFGDMKKTYWLGDRQKLSVKVSQDTETAFTKDQTAIRVVSRIAGNVVLANSCRCLNGI